MPYDRSRKIEQRFIEVISLIQQNPLNAHGLSEALGVSRPTVQRIINELKRRGYAIRSVHDEYGWHYEINNKQ